MCSRWRTSSSGSRPRRPPLQIGTDPSSTPLDTCHAAISNSPPPRRAPRLPLRGMIRRLLSRLRASSRGGLAPGSGYDLTAAGPEVSFSTLVRSPAGCDRARRRVESWDRARRVPRAEDGGYCALHRPRLERRGLEARPERRTCSARGGSIAAEGSCIGFPVSSRPALRALTRSQTRMADEGSFRLATGTTATTNRLAAFVGRASARGRGYREERSWRHPRGNVDDLR